MSCFKKASFIIEGAKLKCYKDNHYEFKLDGQNFQIIKGTVYKQNMEPSEGAAVQVIQICKDNTRSLLGYVMTDKNGEYLFSLEAKPHMKYELTIYAPLSL